MTTVIEGFSNPAYQAVADAFAANFDNNDEVGASVCLTVDGETVVDLWGGVKDTDTGAAWDKDTVSVVFSCTKAATALCAQRLIDRGELDLDEKMSTYWPGFRGEGKDNATVRMALNHSLGLPAFREPLKDGAYNDWDYMVERLEAEAPWWTPGEKNGYHMASFGWTVGELVRRVSGKSLGAFFQDEIAGPLGLEFWIGLPEGIEPRGAPVIGFIPEADFVPTDFVKAVMSDKTSISHLAFLNSGKFYPNGREARAAEIGGACGVGNARSLAMMYRPLANGGTIDGYTLLSPERIEDMRQPSMETDRDQTLLIPSRFGQGFMLSMENQDLPEGNSAAIGEKAFGHVGAGGSIGFADPERKFSFGYTMNKMGGGILLNQRGQSLIDAAYGCLI